MKRGVFIVGVVALLACMRSARSFVEPAQTSLETVWLKDVTTRFVTDKRKFSDLDHPDVLTFNLRRGFDDLTLNLKRNHDIDPNADIYFARTSKDGRSVLVKSRNFEKEDVAYYQDMENGAYMTVRCVKREYEQCERFINGYIQIGDSGYDLRPEETDVTSRNLFEVPGLFGKRYVLQDQTHIQRENSVDKKDAANINEKKVEQELTALLRRLKGQHSQHHFAHSDALLSSQNVTDLRNRAATDENSYSERNKDKSRQLKTEYYVKVAVLIESTIWDDYSAMVPSTNPLTRNRKVKRKIKESYSHIMNGANMRYKGIQDSTISISVILSRFIYFKHKSDFRLRHSKVIASNGRNYIDGKHYLTDLIFWDEDIGKKYKPSFDNAMLFTRYNLYEDNLTDTFHGISVQGHVCDVGTRISIVQASDYLFSSLGAAHELGHSLGASHDGEDDAIACKAEDYFVMTPKEPEITPARPLSRNLWVFSQCSVEAFKRTLKDKKCVTEPGFFYDEQEYMEYVMKHPGEVYTPDDQCHVIIGPNSAYCGVNTVIPKFMRLGEGIHRYKYYTLIGKGKSSIIKTFGQGTWFRINID